MTYLYNKCDPPHSVSPMIQGSRARSLYHILKRGSKQTVYERYYFSMYTKSYLIELLDTPQLIELSKLYYSIKFGIQHDITKFFIKYRLEYIYRSVRYQKYIKSKL